MPATRMSDEAIRNVIARLYADSEVDPPTAKSPIAPLARLIDADCHSVTRLEIAGLTERAAEQDLLQRGALLKPADWDAAEPLAGYMYACGGMGILYVERGDVVERRRFSAAHELGHYLLHFLPVYENGDVESVQTDRFKPAEVDTASAVVGEAPPDQAIADAALHARREVEANSFAAELLMPREVIVTLADLNRGRFIGDDLAWWLAGEMLVSADAMRIRLRTLGISESLGGPSQ